MTYLELFEKLKNSPGFVLSWNEIVKFPSDKMDLYMNKVLTIISIKARYETTLLEPVNRIAWDNGYENIDGLLKDLERFKVLASQADLDRLKALSGLIDSYLSGELDEHTNMLTLAEIEKIEN